MPDPYASPMGGDDQLTEFVLHESVLSAPGSMRHEILTDMMAPLLMFDRYEARSPCRVTYLVIRPFEYFPCLLVEREGVDDQIWVHGTYAGWEMAREADIAYTGKDNESTIHDLVREALAS